ncbi:Uncharacterised protein [Kingella potus]|uniref:Uncharacterized protein n=2 Tax=Kingella potus TaxID=265175 RepID=A0A377R1P7_9NEIS|nr:Imm53 family immunity protein [Kingella potus]STR02848.1 Uncharacterised protein [Kingella potus]
MNPNLTDYLLALNAWHCSCHTYLFHRSGISLSTLDNPGWSLIIKDAGRHGKIQKVMQDYSDDDWYYFKASENIFYSACGIGENNLLHLLYTATEWLGLDVEKQAGFDYLGAMNEWYARQCDGWWEHGNGISFSNIEISGWKLTIEDEEASGKSARTDFVLTRNRSERDWYAVKTEHEPRWPEMTRLFAACGGESFSDMLDISYKWLVTGKYDG